MHFLLDNKVQNDIILVVINMTLKEIRTTNKLTQLQASQIVGISLRSYKQYENDTNKENTFKYRYICDILTKHFLIDEEHGVLTSEFIDETVNNVLNKYDVECCYLFGSYATGDAVDDSDVDLLVDTKITGMKFYGLAEELRQSLHKKIDLLNIDQLNNNPELLSEILKKGKRIFVKR